MRMLLRTLLILTFCFSPLHAFAQATLDGLPRTADWTDLESGAGELPSQPFGTCDIDGADRVGIRVDFDDGTTGSATYSGVSGVWNSGPFTSISPDTETGFFVANCTTLHFLFNNGTSLPMAWDSCSNTWSGNFDLDYNESLGSNFRASTPGWVSARIQTYCGNATAVSAEPEEIPVLPLWALSLLAVLVPLAGALGLKSRRRKA